MNTRHCWHVARILAATVVVITVTASAQGPESVSPGATDRLAEIGGRCPTFIWQAVAAAAFHEVVAYRLPDEMLVADPEELDLSLAEQVVYERVPGGAPAWTPELARCLDPGGSYVWFVRAMVQPEQGEVLEASDWSSGRFFSTSSAPTARELDEALGVLNRYLAQTMTGPNPAAEASTETGRHDGAPTLPGRGRAVSFGGPRSVISAITAIKGTQPDSSGETYGVVGVSNSPAGAGLGAANTNGGPDLVLDGSADVQVDAAVSQSGIDRASASAQTFNIQNSGGGGMNMQVNGVGVLTTASPLDADNVATGLVAPNVGGTGLDTSATGQGSLLYTNATGSWTTLSSGSSGQVLKVSGGVPVWSTDATGGSGTVTEVSTGTGLTGGPIQTTGTVAIDTAVVPRKGVSNTFTESQQIETGTASSNGLVVRGAASQAANLQEWQDSSGTRLAAVTASGKFTGSGFAGNGSGLTGLNATALFSGAIPGPRLIGAYSEGITFNNLTSATITSASIASLTVTGSGTLAGSTLTGGVFNSGSFNGTFTGNGGGLTNLNAASLSTGSIPNGRLGGTYASPLQFSNPGNQFIGTTLEVDTVTLVPASSPPSGCSTGNAGEMYFDSDDGDLCLCDGSGWQPVLGVGACS